ncbi:MAG: hypothetical protein IGS49_25190 [Chlorogloeopsis fritschii C42_A2020_084]|uniref:hypothetical protein n=1 Tax=Chlorogloeopsis fritschii TaxID=1124 RepID=UPI0019EA6D5C|nr:hypothetical protein [Chlorogloeopsis fritschii]MBF2008650.1 hypothetical protein [Chlorogloeopsis fritschii C42_A2020_084]
MPPDREKVGMGFDREEVSTNLQPQEALCARSESTKPKENITTVEWNTSQFI